ncbi:DUF1289 domain-containing protein [Sphingomonas sp. RHCKR7]|uniref:DUF1289 domain-containing protein n=1 Tax=Sphingomonas folli TaxID=2862497 RepID=UPI001C66EDC3|nr:DUF1289 domain-containing protein [Sphingomonas folli]MBW6528484.1 DUF1289 domain-containing protein [Sphingomonas folli]
MRSPCVELCGFDARTGWCQGCGRTREEVRRWRNLRPGDARRVASDLPHRLAKLAARHAKDEAR